MSKQEEWIRIGALRVGSRLLEERPAARCRVEECRAACCGHGVYVDLADAARIVDKARLIKPHLPWDRRNVDAWFDGNVRRDQDFPTGYRVGTEVVDDPNHPAATRCVFLRPDNRCALQAAGLAEGRHPLDLKPFYCALYPVVVDGNTVDLDEENEIYALGGSCQRAEKTYIPAYELFKDELLLVLGQRGYQELCSIARARRGAN